MISDYKAWKTRPEIVGENNIAACSGKTIIAKIHKVVISSVAITDRNIPNFTAIIPQTNFPAAPPAKISERRTK